MKKKSKIKVKKEVNKVNNEETTTNKELLEICSSMLDTFCLMEEHLEEIVKKLSGIEMNTNNLI